MSASLLYFDRFGKPEDELAIIERAKRNPEHFAPLYRKYHEAIFRYVFKRVDEEESAYDITSCVFIKALTNLPKYEYRGIPFSSCSELQRANCINRFEIKKHDAP
jgi:RNA polymerase sigma-70 factor (ECF subfamily)